MAANFDRDYNVRYNISADASKATTSIQEMQRAVNSIRLSNLDETFTRAMQQLNRFNKGLKKITETPFDPNVNMTLVRKRMKSIVTEGEVAAEQIATAFRSAFAEAQASIANPKAATNSKLNNKLINQQVTQMKKQAKAIAGVTDGTDSNKVISNAQAIKAQASAINVMRKALDKFGVHHKKTFSVTIRVNTNAAMKQIDAVYAQLAALKAEAANLFSPVSSANAKKFKSGKSAYSKPITKPASSLASEVARVSLAAQVVAKSRKQSVVEGLTGRVSNIIVSKNALTKGSKTISGLTGTIDKIVFKLKEKPQIAVRAYIKNKSLPIGKDGKGTISIPVSAKLSKSRLTISDAIKNGKVSIPVSAKFNVPAIAKTIDTEIKKISQPPAITVKLNIAEAQQQLKVLLDQIKAASPQQIRLTAKSSGVGSGRPSKGTPAPTGISSKAPLEPLPRVMNNYMRPTFDNNHFMSSSLYSTRNPYWNVHEKSVGLNEIREYRRMAGQYNFQVASNAHADMAHRMNVLRQWGLPYIPATYAHDLYSRNKFGGNLNYGHGYEQFARYQAIPTMQFAPWGGGYQTPKMAAAKMPRQSWTSLMYQITGNTSFGARTPAVVDMAKGMGMMMAVGGAMTAVGSSFHQAIDYQNIMETVRQIQKNNYGGRGDFNRDFLNMEHTVRDVGVKTSFTSSEVAGAAKFLSMAGLDINTINAAIRPVANVALAGDLDLATTADKLTNIMTAFKMKPNEIPHLSDVLVNTFTKTNTSMIQLAESAQYAAPLASLYGLPVEEMLSLIGVMGNAGIQGSMAGTTLRMMIQNILNPSKKQLAWWDKSGVSRVDENGRRRPITAILQDMATKIPEDELISYVMGQFRVTSAAGAGQLVRSMRNVNDLMQSNYSVNGVATNVGEAKMNTLKGMRAQVASLFTEAVTKGMEGNQDRLYNMLDQLKKVVSDPKTVKMIGSLIDLIMEIGKFGAQIAGVWLKIYSTAPWLITSLLKIQFIVTQIGYIVAPFVSIGKIIGGVITKLGLFGAALRSTFSFGLFASGVGNTLGGRGGIVASAGRSLTADQLAMAGALGMSPQEARNRAAVAQRQAIKARRYKDATAAVMGKNRILKPLIGDMVTLGGMTYIMSRNRGRLADSNKRSAIHISDSKGYADRKPMRYEKVNGMYSRYNVSSADNSQFARNMGARSPYTGTINEVAGYRQQQMAARYNSIHRWGKVERGFFGALQAGTIAMSLPSWKNFKTSAINLLFTVMGKLAAGLGALLSPVGMVTVALGGLAAWITYTLYKAKKNDEEVAKAKKVSDDILAKNPVNVINGQGKTAAYGTLTLNSDTDAIQSRLASLATNGVQGGKYKYGTLKNTYLRDIYTKDMNTKRYAQNMYEKYIKGNSDMKFSDVYSSQFINNGYGGYTIQTPYQDIQEKAISAAIIELARNKAPELLRGKNIINSYFQDYANLPDGQRTAAKLQETRQKAAEIANQFKNYENYHHLSDINGVMNGTATVDVAFASYEGQRAIFEELQNTIDNCMGLAQNGSMRLVNIIANMQMQAVDLNGKVAKFYIPLGDDMLLDFQRLKTNLDLAGYKFNMDFWTATNWIAQIYSTLKKMPEYANLQVNELLKMANVGFVPIKESANLKGATIQNFAKSKGVQLTQQESATLTDFWNSGGGVLQRYGNKSLDWLVNTFGGTRKAEYANLLKKAGFSMFDSVKHLGNSLIGSGVDENLKTFGASSATAAAAFTPNAPTAGGKIPAIDDNKTTGSKNGSNKAYQNHYSRQSARPTQIVVNIDSLARFDKTVVANSAEDRDIAEAMERKIGQAVAMLTSQLTAQLSVVGQEDGHMTI